MSKPQRTERELERLGIPIEADWGNYSVDLDQKSAHQQYYGKTNAEMQQYIRNSPIGAADDLRFMPEIPFRYYMLGFRDFVMSGNIGPTWHADATSCFLHLVHEKLEKQPRYIVPIMPELLSAVEYVANNQAAFDADQNIYGDFLKTFARIKELYADAKDRHRRL